MRWLIVPLLVSSLAAAQAPSGIIFTTPGHVRLADATGVHTLAACELTKHLPGTDLAPTREPCEVESLAVHAPSGRWAATLQAPVGLVEGSSGARRMLSYVDDLTLNGERLSLPAPRGGLRPDGRFLVLGDSKGVVAATPGLESAWRTDGLFRPDGPITFTRDGGALLYRESLGAEADRLWLVSFSARPSFTRQLGGAVFKRITLVTGGDRLEVHRSGLVMFVPVPATSEPRLTLTAAPSMPTAEVVATAAVGDELLYYRQGHFTDFVGCDTSRPGRYQRRGADGQEKTWRTHEGHCSTTNTFEGASLTRRSLFFREGPYQGTRLFEYRLDADTAQPLPEGINYIEDLARDGRQALVRADDGLAVIDLDTGERWWSWAHDGECRRCEARFIEAPTRVARR